jgi:methylglutaconyl-CoA hydratase
MALLTGVEQGVMTLRLNRPEKRNALDSTTIEALHAALDQAELDAAVRVIVLRGAGKDFCAGADLEELLASATLPAEQNQANALRLGSIFTRLRVLAKPVVAVVQGRALAGGAGLATAADLVIAAESSQFGYPEVQRGFVPAMVMTMLRRVAGEKRAFDLVATGRLLTASEALAVGLVSRVVPEADLETASQEVIGRLAAASPNALALIKQLFYQLDDRTIDEGIELGAQVNAIARAHPDFKSAIAQFLK